MQERRHSGRIEYRKQGALYGHERFGIDVRADGRTIRAYCEIDEGHLTRDASWTLDAAHRPVEGHVRVVQNGSLVGSSWYCFTGEGAQCESRTAYLGRASQQVPGRVDYLGLHPLVGDGMIALARGTDAPGEARIIPSITCSYDLNGETGLVALPIDIAVTYTGKDEITVPAGTFVADRYALRWRPEWPEAQLWVHGEDAVFLRLHWDVSGLDSQLVSATLDCQPDMVFR